MTSPSPAHVVATVDATVSRESGPARALEADEEMDTWEHLNEDDHTYTMETLPSE